MRHLGSQYFTILEPFKSHSSAFCCECIVTCQLFFIVLILPLLLSLLPSTNEIQLFLFVANIYYWLLCLPFRDACSLWPQYSHRQQPASVSQQPHPHRYYSHFLLSIWLVTDCVRGKRSCRHVLKQLLQNSDILIWIMRRQHYKESCTDSEINIKNASSPIKNVAFSISKYANLSTI